MNAAVINLFNLRWVAVQKEKKKKKHKSKRAQSKDTIDLFRFYVSSKKS